MDADVARSIATAAHIDQRTRAGELVLEHLRRVAEAVGPEDRATAWLHDVLERSDETPDRLRACGLTPVEAAALELLTHPVDESYELYALRVTYAEGEAGRLARRVKLADLEDHLRRKPLDGDPPYAWARRHIAGAPLH